MIYALVLVERSRKLRIAENFLQENVAAIVQYISTLSSLRSALYSYSVENMI